MITTLPAGTRHSHAAAVACCSTSTKRDAGTRSQSGGRLTRSATGKDRPGAARRERRLLGRLSRSHVCSNFVCEAQVTNTQPPASSASWIQRHDRMLTFVGALIVFATFFVKDYFQETYRESLQTAESASQTFAVQSQLSRVSDTLVAIQREQLDAYDQNGDSADIQLNMKKMLFSTKSWLSILNIELLPLYDRANNIDRLCAKVGCDTDALNRVRSKLGKAMAGSSQPFGTALFAPRVAHSKQEIEAARKGILDSYIDPVEELVSDAETELGKLEIIALDTAKAQSEFREKRYRMAQKISIFLYVLGWGLALSARLLGGPATATE